MEEQNQGGQNNTLGNSTNQNVEPSRDLQENKIDINNFQDPELNPLRTYQYDVKEAIEGKNITLSQMMMSEKQKQRDNFQEKEEIFKKQKPQISFERIFIYFISIILFVISGLIIYITQDYVRSNIIASPDDPNSWAYSNIIDSDKNLKIDTAGESANSISQKIQNVISSIEMQKGEIVEIILSKNTIVEDNEVKSRLSGSDFFTILGKDKDHPLVRSLEDDFVIGVHKNQFSSPFLIFQSNDINQTYSELIRWEGSMLNDLNKIFYRTIGNPLEYSSTSFVDIIISNKDVRVLRNDQNQVVLFYSIIDNENIIITDNEETFDLLLSKINLTKLIQ